MAKLKFNFDPIVFQIYPMDALQGYCVACPCPPVMTAEQQSVIFPVLAKNIHLSLIGDDNLITVTIPGSCERVTPGKMWIYNNIESALRWSSIYGKDIPQWPSGLEGAFQVTWRDCKLTSGKALEVEHQIYLLNHPEAPRRIHNQHRKHHGNPWHYDPRQMIPDYDVFLEGQWQGWVTLVEDDIEIDKPAEIICKPASKPICDNSRESYISDDLYVETVIEEMEKQFEVKPVKKGLYQYALLRETSTMPARAKPYERIKATSRDATHKADGRELAVPQYTIIKRVDAPPMPEGLAQHGELEWEKIWASGPWLNPEQDYPWVEMVARAYDEIDEYRKRIEQDGLVVKGYAGQAAAHPLIAEIRKCEQTIMKCLSILGYSPTDRARLGMAEVKKETALQEYIAAVRKNEGK